MESMVSTDGSRYFPELIDRAFYLKKKRGERERRGVILQEVSDFPHRISMIEKSITILVAEEDGVDGTEIAALKKQTEVR